MSGNFYQLLSESHAIEDVFDESCSALVPNDWVLIITDVVKSTEAIERGQYKDVNTAGGLAVMAMANVLNSLDFPFVFGGDGVTMLIPNEFEQTARQVLLDTQTKIQQVFELQLRVGIVPMQVLFNQGLPLRVAKLRLSPYYVQAIIEGEGLEMAEFWIKSASTNSPFLIKPEPDLMEADFSGFTCRWQDVVSEKGEIVSLIVKFRAVETKARQQVLSDLLRFLTACYGDETQCHPIQTKQMRKGRLNTLLREIRIRSTGRTWLTRLELVLKISLEIAFMRTVQFLRLPVRVHWIDLLHIDELNVISSDFRKFDGSLKMVMSGNETSRLQLMNYLEQQYQQGQLYYGLHVSNRAVLTCLMHIKSCGEVHFVDGADGGYAMAAKQLKQQLRA